MYFYLFYLFHGRKRVSDGVAVMGISTGIYDDAVGPVKIRLLYPVYDGTLMIALKGFKFNVLLSSCNCYSFIHFLMYHLVPRRKA